MCVCGIIYIYIYYSVYIYYMMWYTGDTEATHSLTLSLSHSLTLSLSHSPYPTAGQHHCMISSKGQCTGPDVKLWKQFLRSNFQVRRCQIGHDEGMIFFFFCKRSLKNDRCFNMVQPIPAHLPISTWRCRLFHEHIWHHYIIVISDWW